MATAVSISPHFQAQHLSPTHNHKVDLVSAEVQKATESVFSVIVLMFAIMKLIVTQKEQEKLSRREERNQQLTHMEEVAKNYEAQGSQMQGMAIGSGILGILAGFAPVLGHLKGDAILGGLSRLTSKFEGMESKDFFKAISRMMWSGSEVQKQLGQVYQVKYQGQISGHENRTRIHETDGGECTRGLQDKNDGFKGYENFAQSVLQMIKEASSSLYR